MNSAILHKSQISVHVDNEPKEAVNVYIKRDDGVKKLWDYNWVNTEWSECSAECEGGIRTRKCKCTRTDADR